MLDYCLKRYNLLGNFTVSNNVNRKLVNFKNINYIIFISDLLKKLNHNIIYACRSFKKNAWEMQYPYQHIVLKIGYFEIFQWDNTVFVLLLSFPC